MALFFSATDIVEAAIEIERRGRTIYTKAAAATEDVRVKQFLEFFASEETRHQAIFEKMAKRIGPVEIPKQSTPSEYMEYLHSLLDWHALFAAGGPEHLLSEAGNVAAAIELAMRFEKDTILFFTEMQELIPPSERPVIKDCINEERSHFRQLADMLTRWKSSS